MADPIVTGVPVSGVTTRKRTKLKLTARDKKILRLMGEHGCVTAEIIKEFFWNENPKSRAHYRRIAILKRAGWIEMVYGDQGQCLGYRLSKSGRVRFQKMPGGIPFPPIRRAYKSPFQHDQLLIAIERIFTKSPIVKEYRNDLEVRHDLLSGKRDSFSWEKQPILPDAMFIYEVPGQRKPCAVELEITQKSRRRYLRIFRHHLLSKKWDICFYVVKGERFRRYLMEIFEHVKKNDLEVSMAKRIGGIYFCTLEDVLSLGLFAPMTNGKKEFSFAEAAKNFGLAG